MDEPVDLLKNLDKLCLVPWHCRNPEHGHDRILPFDLGLAAVHATREQQAEREKAGTATDDILRATRGE